MEPLSLRHVLNLLAELHGVPESRESALKARFQHFQKIGFPAETKTGRGKPASYTVSAIVKIIMAFELVALRIPPEQAVEILGSIDWEDAGERLRGTAEYLVHWHDDGRQRLDSFGAHAGHLLVLDPDGLTGLRGVEGGEPLPKDKMTWVALSDEDHPWDLSKPGRHFVAINVTRVLTDASLALEKIGVQRADFFKGVLAWFDQLDNHWHKDD